MRYAWMVLVCVYAIVIGGCGKAEEQAVVETYKYGERAIDDGDMLAYKGIHTPKSNELLDECLRLARDATTAETKKLSPFKMSMVIEFRNRMEPEQLRSMTVDGLYRWWLDNEYLVVDAEHGVYPHSAIINGNIAVLQMGVEVDNSFSFSTRRRRGRAGAIGALVGVMLTKDKVIEPVEGFTHNLFKIDDFWYYDTTADASDFDELVIEEAKAEGVSIADYVVMLEEDAVGSVRPSIWQPLPKKKR